MRLIGLLLVVTVVLPACSLGPSNSPARDEAETAGREHAKPHSPTLAAVTSKRTGMQHRAADGQAIAKVMRTGGNLPPSRVEAACPSSPHTAGGADGSGSCWPGPANTGVPAGTALTNYTGPCVITVANTLIDARIVACDLQVRAPGVRITRSRIHGSVATAEDSSGFSFSILDSEVIVGDRVGTGIGAVDFTAERVHVTGGNRSMHCWRDCTIRDSYVHGQFRDDTGRAHESGVRMGARMNLLHNTIACDAPNVPPDAGCSAGLTGYGDYATVENNTIERNLFLATPGGTCAYGGSAPSKPFPNAHHIVFKDNIFQRGTNPSDHGEYICGYYATVMSFDVVAPGNAFINNRYDDGAPVTPAM